MLLAENALMTLARNGAQANITGVELQGDGTQQTPEVVPAECYIGVGESGVNYRAGGWAVAGWARAQRPFVPF